MSLGEGTKLGPYEILGPLGAGGMGQVFRARDTRLDRTVAIKILPREMCADPVRRQRFEREAKTISALNHPNICTLHDVGSQDGVDYLVMECVEGETLAKRLEKGPLPLDQVLKYGAQIADGLDKAHRSGVAHRDLKPGNIMLTSTGVKLLDFGLAKPVAMMTGMTLSAASPVSPVTQEGTIVGTFQYMSPEQIEGKDVDARSDIFSLGAVLYEMVTSKKAFEGKSQLSVASAILEKEPKPICSVSPTTPAVLDRTVRKCLAKNPDERWQSASDLATQLKWVAESGAEIQSSSGSAPVNVRRKSLSWLAALATLAALAAGYYLKPSAERRIVRSVLLPPDKYSFVESGTAWATIALSPDGRSMVVGVQGESGRALLYVRRFSSTEGQMLPGTEGASFPFWSPDSRSIAFFADGQLKRVEATGDRPHVLCNTPEARGGSWNEAGVVIFAPTITTGIFRVSASGGTPVQVTKLDASRHENSHRWPAFLPDNKHFLYFARTNGLTDSTIRIASLDGSEDRALLTGIGNAFYSDPGYLVYPQGNSNKLVAQKFDSRTLTLSGYPVTILENLSTNGNVQHATYSVSRNGMLAYLRSVGSGRSSLKVIDRSGKTLRVIDQESAFFGPSLSPDGTKLAVAATNDQNLSGTDLWIYDIKSSARTRFTFSPSTGAYSYRLPVWSPDGSCIAYSTFRNGHYEIFVRPSNGLGAEIAVYPGEGQRYAMSWSTDGRYLLALEEPAQTSQAKMILVPMSGGEEKPFPILPELPGLTLFSLPRISPNGKWLAYMSNESGRAEIYLTTFPRGEGKWQASTQGAVSPGWSRDSKELFFFSPEDRLQSVTIDTKGDAPIISRPHDLFWVPLLPSANWSYDLFPDGRSIVVNTVINSALAEPISLVENWDAGLEK